MSSWQTLAMRRWPLNTCCCEILSLVLAVLASSLLAQAQASKPPKVTLTDAPEPVYAKEPNDVFRIPFQIDFCHN
jgi:hypothetical protein